MAEGPSPDVAALVSQAAAAIRTASRIGIVGHVGPDGDALGSMLGLAEAARDAGKEVVCSFGEPFVVPRELQFLDLELLVSPKDFPADLDVAIACDTASPDRLGSVGPAVTAADTVIVIDHHVSNGGFGDIAIVDPSAAATAQLAFYLLAELGWALTPTIATALYVGLLTDTGQFQYSMTNREVHRVAGELLAAGVESDVVAQKIYGERPYGYLGVAAAVLGRAELVAEKRFVWSTLYASDLTAAGVTYEDTDGLIDLIRLAVETDVACLLKRLDDDTTKGSLRSRGRVDVGAIAGLFGGGGHHNASGFTSSKPPDEVIAAIVEALP